MIIKSKTIIQSLWIGGSLSTVERLSIMSFLKNDCEFHLYIYDEVENIPEGVIIKDASDILSRDKIFKYTCNGSYAGFSNLFRYKLLYDKGGYWSDVDIICLRPILIEEDNVFCAQGVRGVRSFARRYFFNIPNVNNCFIKTPAGSSIMKYCFDESSKVNTKKLKQTVTGPLLLSKAVKKFNMTESILSVRKICPINYWVIERVFNTKEDMSALENSIGLHLFSSVLNQKKINVDDKFPEESIYETLKMIFLNREGR